MKLNRAMRRKLKKQKKEIYMGRNIEEIKAEYMKTLTDLGDKAFRKAVLESEINQLNQKLSDLNNEAKTVIPQDVPEVPTPAVSPEVVSE